MRTMTRMFPPDSRGDDDMGFGNPELDESRCADRGIWALAAVEEAPGATAMLALLRVLAGPVPRPDELGCRFCWRGRASKYRS